VTLARLQIVWPSGRKDSIAGVKPNQFLTIQEGQGIISAAPINFAPVSRAKSPSQQ